MTLTLAEFLLQRIAEDEAAARDALGAPTYNHWGDTAAEETLEMALSEGCSPAGAAHFRRHDPACVLAECAAKRRIVDECSAADTMLGDDVLRLLALPYADHPDYHEEWKS